MKAKASLRDRNTPVELVPPPSVRPVAVPPVRPASRPSRSLGAITIAAFLGLVGAAFGTFFVLPEWVATNGGPVALPSESEATLEVETPELPRPPIESAPDAAPPRSAPAPRSAAPPPTTPAPERRGSSPPRSEHSGFQTAMSEATSALASARFAEAKEALERAASLAPGAPGLAELVAEAERGLLLEALGAHRLRAASYESREEWDRAVEEYRAALALDPTVRFAQDGSRRAEARAALSRRLDFHIQNPERLSDPQVLQAAIAVRDEASRIATAGTKLSRQIAGLDRIIETASTPVPVRLESDGLTEVIVYRVGRLGTFSRRTLELRPGTYTVVGQRKGYRDVRETLVVESGKKPEPLMVRCVEEIG